MEYKRENGLSIYCQFSSQKKRKAWIERMGLNGELLVSNPEGPIYSYAMNDEGHFRDLCAKLQRDIIDMDGFVNFYRCDCDRLAPQGFCCPHCGADPTNGHVD